MKLFCPQTKQISVEFDNKVAFKDSYLPINLNNLQINQPIFFQHSCFSSQLQRAEKKLAAELTSCLYEGVYRMEMRYAWEGGIRAPAVQLLCLLGVCLNGHGPLNCLFWISTHFHFTVCQPRFRPLAPNLWHFSQITVKSPRTSLCEGFYGNTQAGFGESHSLLQRLEGLKGCLNRCLLTDHGLFILFLFMGERNKYSLFALYFLIFKYF